MSDKTTVIENRHFYAKCWECRYTGPLRYRRDLAQSDADRHRTAEHPDPAHDPVVVDERAEWNDYSRDVNPEHGGAS